VELPEVTSPEAAPTGNDVTGSHVTRIDHVRMPRFPPYFFKPQRLKCNACISSFFSSVLYSNAKIDMQLFWIKNDDFTDLVAHARLNRADNRIQTATFEMQRYLLF
jgi:hypothetical protein